MATPPSSATPGPATSGPATSNPITSNSVTSADRLSAAQRRGVEALLTIAPVVDELAVRFHGAGEQLALVGGSVRDALLGRLGHDLDFTTSARPDITRKLLKGWAEATWDTGVAFGTLGAHKGGYQIEITTWRADQYEPGSRKPAVRFGDSLQDDLVRRDFAVNAMAVAFPGGHFVDPFGGLGDLADRLLRTPGAPEDSFSDDPLRMMRAARFAAQLGFEVDPDVVLAMTAMAERINIVSAERVRDEFVKTLLSPRPRRGLELLVRTGLADLVIPELPALAREVDEHRRHKDVYEHTLIVLEQAMDLEDPAATGAPGLFDAPAEATGPTDPSPADGSDADGESATVAALVPGTEPVPTPDLVLRLAALLHDIGKPRTRVFHPDGTVSFHNHDVVGARLARKRLTALKFDSHTTDDVCTLVELHLRFHGYGEAGWTDSAVRRYVRDAGPLLSRLHRLTRADCTTRNRRKALVLEHAYDDLEHRIVELSAQEALDSVRPDLDGHQIMALLDMKPGPQVGKAYQFLLEARLELGPLSQNKAEELLREWWADQRG